MGVPAISPDGSQLAFLSHREGEPLLIITNLGDGTGVLIDTSEVKTRAIRWAGDHTVLLTASETGRFAGYRGEYEISRVFAVDTVGDLNIRQIPRNGRLIGVNVGLSHVVAVDWDQERLLMPVRSPDDRLNLLSVDLGSGRARMVARGSTSTRDWIVDGTGEPTMRLDYSNARNRLRIRRFIDDEWKIVVDEAAEIPNISPLGLTRDTGELAVGVRFTTPGVSGVYAMSAESGEITRLLIENPDYDIEDVIIDPYTSYVLGAHIQTKSAETIWIDPDFQEQQELLDAAFTNMSARIVSWSRDRSRLIVRVENGATAPIYYLFDVAERRARAIGAAYPALVEARLPSRQPFSYKARDGQTIPGYLTLPADLDPHNLPLVLLPHGGPEARDTGGFHYLAHFIASHGYAVLQPNFRGSEGFGLAWRDAGRGSWGTGTMQHDLTDGVTALIEAGTVDPERVCIVGASYGGYAALAGATFTPEVYACAAAIAPVSNVARFLADKRQQFGRRHWLIEYWDRVLGGDEDSQRRHLREISPALHAENVRAPILLLHGRDDTVVEISQSNRMERALRRAGADVRLVRLDGEDHWLSTTETRTQVLMELESFLAEHLE